MEDEIQDKKAGSDKYRLVVMNDETFEEIRSFRLSMSNLYGLFSIVFVLISFMVLAFVIFTPVKRLIPGYADVNNNKEFVELLKKIEVLEDEMEAQNAYINGVQNLLDGMGGNSELLDEAPSSSQIETATSSNETKKSTPIRTNKLDQLFLVSPVRGEISQRYKVETNHFGVDIVAPANTPIKCIIDGIVISADWSIETGHTISVQHPNNLISIYKHNSVLLKKIGNLVKAGEALAIIGNTGELTNGPHLHFELWYGGKPVNPEEFISF